MRSRGAHASAAPLRYAALTRPLNADVGRLISQRRYTSTACTPGSGLDMKLTAVFQKVREGYIGFVEELPGANTQARTLKQARANLAEAVELVLQANRSLSKKSIGKKKVIREPLVLAVE